MCRGSSKSPPSREEDLSLMGGGPLSKSGIQNHSEEQTADIRHLSEME
jgi:hypothetical protein